MPAPSTFFETILRHCLSIKQAVLPWRDKRLSEIQKQRALQSLTLPKNDPQLLQQRKEAATLIEAVLDEILSPTQALVKWPVKIHSHNHKRTAYLDINDDPSLQAAYQILWHFEADEAQQRQEVFYLDTQLALLGQVSELLAKGEELPLYMLELYTTEHEAHFYSGFSFEQFIGQFLLKPVQSIIKAFSRVLPYRKRPL